MSSTPDSLRSPVVAFDIEVAGVEWEQVDEATRHYLMPREKKRGQATDAESIQHRLALVRGMGRVVSIAMWNLDKDQGAVLVQGSGCVWEDFAPIPGVKAWRGNEKEMLAEFWRLAKEWGTVVTYNGRAYDGPVLMVRSAMLDVVPSRQLCGYRYSFRDHCDLMDLLNFQGATRDSYSLDYWCRRFGVESPKGKMDGSMVADKARSGHYDEIAEYCLRDTQATADLFRRLRGTLVPLFSSR